MPKRFQGLAFFFLTQAALAQPAPAPAAKPARLPTTAPAPAPGSL